MGQTLSEPVQDKHTQEGADDRCVCLLALSRRHSRRRWDSTSWPSPRRGHRSPRLPAASSKHRFARDRTSLTMSPAPAGSRGPSARCKAGGSVSNSPLSRSAQVDVCSPDPARWRPAGGLPWCAGTSPAEARADSSRCARAFAPVQLWRTPTRASSRSATRPTARRRPSSPSTTAMVVRPCSLLCTLTMGERSLTRPPLARRLDRRKVRRRHGPLAPRRQRRLQAQGLGGELEAGILGDGRGSARK